MLQTGSLLCFDKMIEKGIDENYASKLVQHGWETVAEGLKHGGITNMMDRLSNPAKLVAVELADDLKKLMAPLFQKHMDDIVTGNFSSGMMDDWKNDDKKLLTWRETTAETPFEKSMLPWSSPREPRSRSRISHQPRGDADEQKC